jgi:hypothetical protein
MKRYECARLIREVPKAHGVHADTAEADGRMVFVELSSVMRDEFYNAYNAGLRPEIVARLELAEDYQDEKLVELKGKRYRVIRTYMTADDGIELTLQRWDVK